MGKKISKVRGKDSVDLKTHRFLQPMLTEDQFFDEFVARYRSQSEFNFLCGSGSLFVSMAKVVIEELEGDAEIRTPHADYIEKLMDGSGSDNSGMFVTKRMNDDAIELYRGGDVTGMRICHLEDVCGAGVEAEVHSKVHFTRTYLCSFVWKPSNKEVDLKYELSHCCCECGDKKKKQKNVSMQICSHVIAAFYSLVAAYESPERRPPNAVLKSLEKESASYQLRRKYFWPIVVRGWSIEFVLNRKPPLPDHPKPTLSKFLEHASSCPSILSQATAKAVHE